MEILYSTWLNIKVYWISILQTISIKCLAECTVSLQHFLISLPFRVDSLTQAPNLHIRLPSSLTRVHFTNATFHTSRFIQLPHITPSLSFKQLHSPIISTCHQKVLVELERNSERIVCGGLYKFQEKM